MPYSTYTHSARYPFSRFLVAENYIVLPLTKRKQRHSYFLFAVVSTHRSHSVLSLSSRWRTFLQVKKHQKKTVPSVRKSPLATNQASNIRTFPLPSRFKSNTHFGWIMFRFFWKSKRLQGPNFSSVSILVRIASFHFSPYALLMASLYDSETHHFWTFFLTNPYQTRC